VKCVDSWWGERVEEVRACGLENGKMLFNFWLKNGLNQFFLATWILLPGLIGGEKVGLGVELAPGNVSG